MDEDVKSDLGCLAKGLIVVFIVVVIGFGLIVGMCGGFPLRSPCRRSSTA